jgi:Uma2 family endonuclease
MRQKRLGTTMAHTIAPQRTMTYEEFRAWATDEVRAEWVDGEVIELMPPGLRHQEISMFLSLLFGLYVKAKGLGRVLHAPFEMNLRGGRSYREPDLIFVATDHLDRFDDQRLNGPADLVIEIIFSDSITRDWRDKLAEYAASGIPEYWIVDPRPGQPVLTGFSPGDDGDYQAIPPDGAGRLFSTVLPGFYLHPEWLSADPLPNALALLAEINPDLLRSSGG